MSILIPAGRYPGDMTGWAGLGSSAHRALIGSVSAGTWHELSDVDFDIVIDDDARVAPADEIAALSGPRAAVILARDDSADRRPTG